MNKEKTITSRNYGIDFLRIISMLFVVILHCTTRGGLLSNISTDSIEYKVILLVNIFTYCAVDIFALISGYVLYKNNEKFHYSNYFKIWLQVVYYSLIITIIFNIMDPSIISKKDYIKALLPVTSKSYWYLNAYTGLFIFIPFINSAIKNCNDKYLKKIFIVIFCLFSIYDLIPNSFNLIHGYSFIWLILLYIMGAIIKKTNLLFNIKRKYLIVAIFTLNIITYLFKYYIIDGVLHNLNITRSTIVSYTSPTILGVAIAYILLFSKLDVKGLLKKFVIFAAPSTFIIYIINTNPIIWDNVIYNMFIGVCNNTIYEIIILVMLFSILFVICCIIVDKFRIFLFNKLKIKKMCNKISDEFSKIICVIADKI